MMYEYVRVVKHPEEPGEVFAERILEHEWIMIVRPLDVLAGGRGVGKLIPKIWRLADEEVAVYSEQVVFDLSEQIR